MGAALNLIENDERLMGNVQVVLAVFMPPWYEEVVSLPHLSYDSWSLQKGQP